ncbi:MAG: hypothetical protein ACYDCN_08045 [Bacteroidia bacterium]
MDKEYYENGTLRAEVPYTDGIIFTLGKVSPDSRYKYVHTHPIGTKLWTRGRLNFSEKKGGEQAYILPLRLAHCAKNVAFSHQKVSYCNH